MVKRTTLDRQATLDKKRRNAKRYRRKKKTRDQEYFPPGHSRQPTLYHSTTDNQTDDPAPRSSDEDVPVTYEPGNVAEVPADNEEDDHEHADIDRVPAPVAHDSSDEDPGPQYRGPPTNTDDDPLATYSYMLAQIKQWGLSRENVQKLYEMTNENAASIARLQRDGILPKQARTLTKSALEHVPPVTMKYWTEKKKATRTRPRILECRTGPTIPKHILHKSKLLVRAVASVKLQDIITFHNAKHPSCSAAETKDIYLSSDGVQPTQSGSHKLDVISVAFAGCGTAYPLQVWRYQGDRPTRNSKKKKKVKTTKNKPSLQLYYTYAVDQALKAHRKGLVSVKAIIADGKERKHLKVCAIITLQVYFVLNMSPFLLGHEKHRRSLWMRLVYSEGVLRRQQTNLQDQ